MATPSLVNCDGMAYVGSEITGNSSGCEYTLRQRTLYRIIHSSPHKGSLSTLGLKQRMTCNVHVHRRLLYSQVWHWYCFYRQYQLRAHLRIRLGVYILRYKIRPCSSDHHTSISTTSSSVVIDPALTSLQSFLCSCQLALWHSFEQ